MKAKLPLIMLLIVFPIIAGISIYIFYDLTLKDQVQPNVNTNQPSYNNLSIVSSETVDDFHLYLASEKEVYDVNDEVMMIAELTYKGEKHTIDIFHAASPFFFNIKEETRGINIDYAMDQPLLQTTLEKDLPLREKYEKTGGYSDQDDKEFVAFMKEFLAGETFPKGKYTVEGVADFYISEDGGNKTYNIKTIIQFEVK
ncbi:MULTISPECIES: hypothetical protein [Bacillus]|uniref:hypothetical protein n=1 Tax=Bacillus TaxID=1386 RepID=UPI000BB97C83|nr:MULTISPECIES: hypothetical protein [Bacillus]